MGILRTRAPLHDDPYLRADTLVDELCCLLDASRGRRDGGVLTEREELRGLSSRHRELRRPG